LIILISGYIKQSGCSLSEFWDYWTDWHPKLLTSGAKDSVFDITLRDLGRDSLRILGIMAVLNSDRVPTELLVRHIDSKPGPTYLKANRFRIMMSALVGQRFISETRAGGREMYQIHRTLQARLLANMNADKSERDEIFRTAFELVRYHLPRPSLETPELSKWDMFKEYLPHVISLQSFYADQLSTPTSFLGLAELFKDGGVLLWQQGIYTDALKLLKSAEEILDELQNSDGNLRTEINITINLLLQYFGIQGRKESQHRLGQILRHRESVVKNKDPGDVTLEEEILLYNARADYANGLLQLNDYEAAESIYQSCYAKYVQLGSGASNHHNARFALAKLQHHMAYCLMYRRQFDKAIKLAESAVDMVGTLGEGDMKLSFAFDLACIILQSGNEERAMSLHREILEARLGLQGRASYFTLQSQYAYAAMCRYTGKLDEAEHLMRQALNKATKTGRNLWPEAAVARTKYHLSRLLQDKSGGEYNKEAEELAGDAKDTLAKLLPYDPSCIVGVEEEDTGALFDQLQPVFGARFTGLSLLKYVSKMPSADSTVKSDGAQEDASCE